MNDDDAVGAHSHAGADPLVQGGMAVIAVGGAAAVATSALERVAVAAYI